MASNGKRNMRLLAAGALLAGTALLAGGFRRMEGSKVKTYPQQEEQGYSTLLMYLDGSDLESSYGAAGDDLEEIREAVARADPEGKDIRIVVEAGGARQWQYSQMEDYSYGRFCMTGAGVSEVTELETRDMGRADTLADFINYGIQSYPAEHYGLIFWNHGAGQIEGFGRDENFGYSALSLQEIKEGMELSAYQEPFDFIGMDACLMGSLEMVSILQGKAGYFIASEELEPQDGYDYSWVEALKEPEEDEPYGKQAGLAMLESFEEFYQGKKLCTTLALVDMEKYDRFHDVFHKLLSLLPTQDADSETMYQELGRLRGQIQGFGQQGAETMPEQVDVMDFLWYLLEASFPETFQGLDNGKVQEVSQESGLDGQGSGAELQELYQELRDAYGQMVIRKSCNGYAQEPSGMNLYLPSGDNSQIRIDGGRYQALPFCEKYQAFTENYIKYLTAGWEIPWEEPFQEGGELKAEIPPSQQDKIANAYGAVSVSQDGCTYLISADGDTVLDQSGYLKAPMEDTFWGLKGQILCLVENYTKDGETEYAVPILYQKAGSGWAKCSMRIRFSEDCPDGEIVQIEPYEISKQVYALEAGDALIPLYPLFVQESTGQADIFGTEDVLALPYLPSGQEDGNRPEGIGFSVQAGNAAGEEIPYTGNRIYQKEYYMGAKITMEHMEAGDGDLEKIKWQAGAKLQYGFLIRDTKMELHYIGTDNQ